MVDFDELRRKAEDLAEKNADKVDAGIDKAADLLGERFGHADRIDAAAEKLKDAIPGEGKPSVDHPDRPARPGQV